MLEGIDLESLEAVDIEDSDELVNLLIGFESFVDLVDNPVKQVRVDALGESISGMLSLEKDFIKILISFHSNSYLDGFEGRDITVIPGYDLLVAEPLPQVLLLDLHEGGHHRETGVIHLALALL